MMADHSDPCREALAKALELSRYAAAPFFGSKERVRHGDEVSYIYRTTEEWWDGLRDLIEAAQPMLAAAESALAQPPAPERGAPSMPECWSVEVSSGGETLVSIGPNWLSGKEPSDEDEQTIIGAAQHLLSFVGYGLPESTFNPDAAPPMAEALAASAAAEGESNV